MEKYLASCKEVTIVQTLDLYDLSRKNADLLNPQIKQLSESQFSWLHHGVIPSFLCVLRKNPWGSRDVFLGWIFLFFRGTLAKPELAKREGLQLSSMVLHDPNWCRASWQSKLRHRSLSPMHCLFQDAPCSQIPWDAWVPVHANRAWNILVAPGEGWVPPASFFPQRPEASRPQQQWAAIAPCLHSRCCPPVLNASPQQYVSGDLQDSPLLLFPSLSFPSSSLSPTFPHQRPWLFLCCWPAFALLQLST